MKNTIRSIIGIALVLIICLSISGNDVEAASRKNGLAKPQLISCKNTTPSYWKYCVAGNRYTLKWKKVNGAKGYQVQYSGREWGEKNYGGIYTDTTKDSYYHIGGSCIDKFKIRVRAYKVVNGKKVYGPWSKWVERKFVYR